MAGCSLTVTWLDDQLESLWRAAADTPAYRKGVRAPLADGRDPGAGARRRPGWPVAASGELPRPASAPACSYVVLAVFERIAATTVGRETEFGHLDAVAGDGDHGRGMRRGAAAALDAARLGCARGAAPGQVIAGAGEAWAAHAGGTSGALWGAGLMAMGAWLGAETEPEPNLVCAALRAAHGAIIDLGGARPGDKTMLDAFDPFVATLASEAGAGASLRRAWRSATDAAEDAALATAELRPRLGRARPLAERSVGSPDPGAVSLAACLRAVLEAIEEASARA
jgi:dihydroxyacetone kinase